MKKVLCHNCKQWSTTPQECEHCGHILCRVLQEEIVEQEIARNTPPEPPSKLKKAMDYLKNSKNPFLKVLYYILMSIWLIYVGFMLIIMYFISFATG